MFYHLQPYKHWSFVWKVCLCKSALLINATWLDILYLMQFCGHCKKTSHSYSQTSHIITHHCPHACHINEDEKTTALSVLLWMPLPMSKWRPLTGPPHPPSHSGFVAHKAQVWLSTIKGNRSLWHIKKPLALLQMQCWCHDSSVFTGGQRRELQTIDKQKPEELYDTDQCLCLSSINDCSRKSD